MLKTAKTLKRSNFEEEAVQKLRELLSRIPFLEIKSIRPFAKVFGIELDALFEVENNKQPRLIVVEAKRSGQPREVRQGVLQLNRFLQDIKESSLQSQKTPCFGVFIAPFISQESARLCAEAGISYADLAGNARISFDQIYIETQASENPFREKRELRSLFSPRATRILRMLLQGPLRAWKVTELAKSAQVSSGWVSAVRNHLLAREWAEESPEGLRLSKPDLLLDAWAKADEWQKRTETREYSTLHVGDPLELGQKLRRTLGPENLVFTQWFAGWLRHPYTVPQIVTAYVRDFPDDSVIERGLLARRVQNGGRLRLVLPKDEGVFHLTQVVQNFTLASDAQIYVDLISSGNRGEEQATELRKWPDFSGGWK